MKKFTSLITILLLCASSLFAQAPEKFTYQAVVRNASNQLVANAPVGVRVSILQGGVNGMMVYMETHTAVTNANGLVTLQIGGGMVQQGVFADIDWANGPFFLKTETDPNGGSDYTVTSTQQLLSVPYALYAREAGNSFSGDYNDLTNTPTIPTVPANVSAFTNDAGYITMSDLPAPAKGDANPKSASVIQTDACGEIDLCQLAHLLAQQQIQIEEMRNALLPTVTTGAVNNVTDAAAICGGTVTANGYDEVTERGVCWSTEPNPTVAGSHTSDGIGTGEFTSTLTNLQSNTIYYVRAYATNSVSTAYGEELSFATVDTCTTITLPYSEDFENFTTSTAVSTGVQPVCWVLEQEDVTMTSATQPQLFYKSSFAHSGNYSLMMRDRCMYAMPALSEDVQMNHVRLEMYLRQANAVYQLEVGVWEDNGTFVPVALFNNSTTGVTRVECDFSDYTGNGRRIAFHNVLGGTANYSYSYNYIDDITLDTVLNGNSIAMLPTVTTGAISSITATTAISGGEVTTDGDAAVTERGVCWATEPNPTVEGNHTSDGTGMGTFTSSLTGLTAGITYYVRAYATNSVGTAYGEEVGFTTVESQQDTCATISLPFSEDFESYTTSTTAATGVQPDCWKLVREDVAMTDAKRPQLYYKSSFAHSGDYSLKMENRCVYAMPVLSEDVQLNQVKLEMYLRQPNASYRLQVGVWEESSTFVPVATFNNSTTNVEFVEVDFSNYSGNGRRIAFRNVLGGGANYNYSYNYIDDIKLYVIINGAVVDEKSCPGTPTVTDHEGNVYATVQIGEQCWMRENLRTTHYADGDSIPAGGSNYSNTEPFYYDYSSHSLPLETRGYLYNWPAAMHSASSSNANPSGVQGICPTGWHLPSDAEWTQLTDYVGSQSEYRCGGNSSYIAKALASTEGWNTHTGSCTVGNDQTSNNASGFSVVPAGYWNYGFYNAGYGANFWSSTECGTNYAWFRYLDYDDATVGGGNGYRSDGFSVRCLRNEGNSAVLSVSTVSVTDVTSDHATVTGSVTDDGGETVTQRGFVYDTLPYPTIYSTVVYHGSGVGQYSNLLNGLLSGKTYYVRAFAQNSLGVAYGNELSFTTSVPMPVAGDAIPCPGTPTVTDHEGNVYNTVQIGMQCWTKENMRATTSPSTGTYLIPPAGTSLTYTGKQAFWYNNDSAAYAPMNYGLLYNWNAAVDTFNTAYGEISVNTGDNNVVLVNFTGNRRGICPAGWHLPSDAEWTQLINYVGSQSEYTCGGNGNYIAKALASETGWNTNTGICAVGNDQSSNNVMGFSVVPAGSRSGVSFGEAGDLAIFWSSTQCTENVTFSRYLRYDNAEVGMPGYHEKDYGYSVRCVRD